MSFLLLHFRRLVTLHTAFAKDRKYWLFVALLPTVPNWQDLRQLIDGIHIVLPFRGQLGDPGGIENGGEMGETSRCN